MQNSATLVQHALLDAAKDKLRDADLVLGRNVIVHAMIKYAVSLGSDRLRVIQEMQEVAHVYIPEDLPQFNYDVVFARTANAHRTRVLASFNDQTWGVIVIEYNPEDFAQSIVTSDGIATEVADATFTLYTNNDNNGLDQFINYLQSLKAIRIANT